MVLMITYDLNSTGQKYEEVIKAIKDSSLEWCSYWKSSYLVKTNFNPSQFFEKLKPFIDGNDKLLIVESVKNYYGWLSEDQWKFIKENIFG